MNKYTPFSKVIARVPCTEKKFKKNLRLAKTHFFPHFNLFRENLEKISITYQRETPGNLSSQPEPRSIRRYRKTKGL
jgi:hypothetical protein